MKKKEIQIHDTTKNILSNHIENRKKTRLILIFREINSFPFLLFVTRAKISH